MGTEWNQSHPAQALRLDADAVKPGDNVLELKVVNLWINRQIGDEQLPEDSDRNPSGNLKSWPQWVQNTKASPTGRFTFFSWRLWKKNSPFVESGLIGPVTLLTVERVECGSAKERPGDSTLSHLSRSR